MEKLDQDDVLDLEKAPSRFGANPTCRVRELIESIKSKHTNSSNGSVHPDYRFFDKGIPCRVLSVKGGGWRIGTLKLVLQFVPDQSDSPLDGLRQ